MKELFEATGWSNRQLAKRTNVDAANISRWLNSKTTIPAWFIVAFCKALDVRVEGVIRVEGGDRGPALVRRGALRDTAKLLRQVSDQLEHGNVPEISP